MKRRYIRHSNRAIFAIFYRSTRTMYYNLNFTGKTIIIVLK